MKKALRKSLLELKRFVDEELIYGRISGKSCAEANERIRKMIDDLDKLP